MLTCSPLMLTSPHQVEQFKATLKEMDNFIEVDRALKIVDSAGAVPARYTWLVNPRPCLMLLNLIV